MNFQIIKLVIWPKDSGFPPREVEFKPNKVNVITGASRTGKSAIIPIIDYCLASSTCSIPIDTIRAYSAWYGVVLRLSDGEVMVARRVPQGNEPSDDFFYRRSSSISIPHEIEGRNCSEEEVKHNLNEIALLPYFGLDEVDGEPSGYKSRLSIRDLMAFVFQTQDIVANQNILFYKTHAHQHREKLRNWFPFILGAETIEVLKARQRLQLVERKLAILRREFEREKAISDQWKSNIFGHLRTAADYGILNEEFSENDDAERLIEIGRALIAQSPDKPVFSSDAVVDSNRELSERERSDNSMALQVAQIRSRLEAVDRLKEDFSSYGAVAQRRVKRLHISKWLTDVVQDAESCPVCGEAGHEKAVEEMQKIAGALSVYEEQASKFHEVPTSFDREEERLKRELESILEEKAANQERYDWLLSRNQSAKDEFYRSKEMYIFLGHFKASLGRFEKLLEGGGLDEQIKRLEKEQKRLRAIVDEVAIRRRVDAATEKISQIMLSYLKDLDVEDKYRQRRPEVNVQELAIRVMSDEGDWHFLAEVGSASNWVSFHIAAMCAFQEFFADLTHSSVPNFVIFDQPSQVYFPKVRKVAGESDADHKNYKDEDSEAVRQIFKVLSESVSKRDSVWQFIVLDHADSDIYGDIPNVHEVEIWRDGNRLIPEAWYRS